MISCLPMGPMFSLPSGGLSALRDKVPWSRSSNACERRMSNTPVLNGEQTASGLATGHEQDGTCSCSCWLTAAFHLVEGLGLSDSLDRSA